MDGRYSELEEVNLPQIPSRLKGGDGIDNRMAEFVRDVLCVVGELWLTRAVRTGYSKL